jgi:Dockerin type I domain
MRLPIVGDRQGFRITRSLGTLAVRLAWILLLVPAGALPAQPLGSELRINTYTSFNQRDPSVATLTSGEFVAVWDSSAPPTSIRGQLLSADFTPVGTEILVSTSTGNEHRPRVAADPGGGFVVVWVAPDSDLGGVFARRYAASGAPSGGEFRVNAHTTGDQAFAAVSAIATGGFVVAWSGKGPGDDGTYNGVFAQRFDSGGAPVSIEFRVNTFTTHSQDFPAVASDPSGKFVVAWSGAGQGDEAGIFAQRFDGAGSRLGAEFRVNTYTSSTQQFASVAANAAGFTVVWMGPGAEDPAGIYGQRYSSTGQPAGGEFRVNTTTTGLQAYPTLAIEPASGFVVVWATVTGDNGIFAQRFTPSGVPFGPEFRVSSAKTFFNYQSVAAGSRGDFVVAWYDGPASNYDVFGRRFGPICAHGDVNGDGSVTVADVFYLINFLFASGPAPICGGDVNGDKVVTLADVFYLINFLFAAGPAPV